MTCKANLLMQEETGNHWITKYNSVLYHKIHCN